MNIFRKLFVRIKEKDSFGFFAFESKVYAVLVRGSKTFFGVSKNGLDFKLQKDPKGKIKTAWEKAQKKRLAEAKIYQNSLGSGSERLGELRVEGVIRRKKEIWVFFDWQKEKGAVEVGVVAFERQNSGRVLWRGTEPVWESPQAWRGKKAELVGFLEIKQKNLAYWKVEGLGITVVSYPRYRIDQKLEVKKSWFIRKEAENPLIGPNPENGWEAFTTFNPAAIYLAEKVHILYRAQGFDYRSVLGYARSDNGLKVEEKLKEPAYVPRQPFEIRDKSKKPDLDLLSGGGEEGCEDPRLTQIGKTIYMTYVAFNGWLPPRIALTSIKVKDFLAKRWFWERPVLISPPGVVDKSAALLPERVGGKYVIFHRIFPDILVDYVDSLEFEPGEYLKGEHKIKPRSPLWWDSRKIGVGAPPLLTKDGWLLIYQTVDDKDAGHYKVGAMILKKDEPHVELYRSRHPIIEPDQWYENEGFKAGVVYPCGAVIIKERLFVYYGGADSYVCVATADLNQFLDKLKEGQEIQLEGTILGVES